MKSLALIDADIVAYRCAATCNGLPQEIAEVRTDELMRRILHETNATDYQAWLTGSNNFRYTIYPEYKANRKDVPRPEHLQACREFLVTNWKARVTDGNEADDELGIEQSAQGMETVICSIDKDLLQVPGYHYNFVRGIESFVSPLEGLRSFYKSLITGDATDNIPAFDGKFRTSLPKKVEKLLTPLDDMTDEVDMFLYCLSLWCKEDDQEADMHRYAKCLWIQRKENDLWQSPQQN